MPILLFHLFLDSCNSPWASCHLGTMWGSCAETRKGIFVSNFLVLVALISSALSSFRRREIHDLQRQACFFPFHGKAILLHFKKRDVIVPRPSRRTGGAKERVCALPDCLLHSDFASCGWAPVG